VTGPDTAWSPTAFISYQTADASTAELLHEELALHGLSVIHDRCSFPTSERVLDNMADAVEACDVFIAYVTPSYLYEGTPSGALRPAIDNEFKPAVAKRRRPGCATSAGKRRPVLLAFAHGLGDPRTVAQDRIRAATTENMSSLWLPFTLDQSTPGMTPAEASRVAREALRSVLDPSAPIEEVSWPIDLSLVTRGTGFRHGLLSIDGTSLFGGPTNRSGESANWSRLLVALRDVEAVISKWPEQRELRLLARCHLSAAVAFGRVFNQAAGWRLAVQGRGGEVRRAVGIYDHALVIEKDTISSRGDLSVEIDLLGHPVFDMATEALASRVVGERLQMRRRGSGEIPPEGVPALAANAAQTLRERISALRPSLIHIFCSSPVEFAVFLGHELTSLHADLQLYERDGARYAESLTIPAATP